MFESSPAERPIEIERDWFKFIELAFDSIMEKLRYLRGANHTINVLLKEVFWLREKVEGVKILQKPINLQLECPKCSRKWTSEEGVARMFYKAIWIEREKTWRFEFNIKVQGIKCSKCRPAEVYGLKNVWMADVVEAGSFFGAAMLDANSRLVDKITADDRSTINKLPHQVVTDL